MTDAASTDAAAAAAAAAASEAVGKATGDTVCVLITGVNGQQRRERLSRPDYARMMKAAQHVLLRQWQLAPRNVTLLATGGAWADHVAIDLFLRAHAAGRPFAGLRVQLPCAFAWADRQASTRVATDRSSHFSAGAALNAAHAQFDTHLQRASWGDLLAAQRLGAVVEECDDGMHARNRRLASKAQRLLTFTRDDASPLNGSARQLWDLCACPRAHVSIAAAPNDAPAQAAASAQAAAAVAPAAPTPARRADDGNAALPNAGTKRTTGARDARAFEQRAEKRARI